MDEEAYAQVPEGMKVRELRFKVQKPGFRINELVLVTTMLDAEEYTREELARLYFERWNIELDLRAIKCIMQMDVSARRYALDGEEGDLDALPRLKT